MFASSPLTSVAVVVASAPSAKASVRTTFVRSTSPVLSTTIVYSIGSTASTKSSSALVSDFTIVKDGFRATLL